METVQQNAVGVVIRGTVVEDDVAVDVSAATTKEIILRSPCGVSRTKTAVFTTDGTDGKIQYVTIANDLDESGVWEAQAYVVFTLGFNGRSEITNFFVAPNL